MKNFKRDNIFVINHRFMRINFALLSGMLFIIFAFIVDNSDSYLFYLLIILIASALLLGWVLFPIACIVNSQGIKIIYAFNKNKFTDFKQIRKIYIEEDFIYRGSFITRYNYVFDGMILNRKYMQNKFMKCKKLEKSLVLYTKEKLHNNSPKNE